MRLLCLSLSLLFTSACANPVRGLIYQDITLPYALNMDETPVGDLRGSSSSYRLQEPLSGANISVEWNSFGLGDSMKNGVLGAARLVDIRLQSAALGLWRRNTLVVSGVADRIEEKPQASGVEGEVALP